MSLRCLLLVILASAVLIAAAGCDNEKGSDVSTGDSSSDASSDASADNGEVSLEMSSGDSTILFKVTDDLPYIVSLIDSAGNNAVSDSPLSLPLSVTIDGRPSPVSWTYTGAERNAAELNGVASDVLKMSFKCVEYELEYRLYCVTRPAINGPFEFYSELQNNTGADIRYSAACMFTATLHKDENVDPVAWSFKKESGAAEGIDIGTFYTGGEGIYTTTLRHSAIINAWVSVFQNWNESGYIPLLYIQYGEEHGVCFALEWSAGRIAAESDGDNVLLRSNMNDVSDEGGNFSTVIKEGDTFLNPSVYLGVYTGDVDDGSNVYKHWFFECKAPSVLRDNENEPLTQMDMQCGLDVSSLNAESVKWDYGWWSDDVTVSPWRTLEGSWELRNSGYISVVTPFGGTLRSFGDAAKKLGINWTTYGLLHSNITQNRRATADYGEFNLIDHPEWFSNRVVADGMGNSADLGNTECVAYLQKYLANYFTSNSVGTWRSDFEPICYFSDKENRHDANGTDVQYWCTRGFLELTSYLYENVDGFRYESCSSGGSMKDLITATQAVVFNTDDSANYLSLRTTFYDSSYCICPSQLQLPCNPDCFNIDSSYYFPQFDSDQDNLADAVTDMGFRSTLLGVMSYGVWSGNVSGYLDYYTEYYGLYRDRLRPLVRYAELYHVLPRPDGVNWDGVLYADPDAAGSTKGALFVFKPSLEAGDSVNVNIRGLDPKTVYTVSFYDGSSESYTATGEKLMSEGVTVTISGIGSEIVWFEA